MNLEERNARLEELKRYKKQLPGASFEEAAVALKHEDARVRVFSAQRLGDLGALQYKKTQAHKADEPEASEPNGAELEGAAEAKTKAGNNESEKAEGQETQANILPGFAVATADVPEPLHPFKSADGSFIDPFPPAPPPVPAVKILIDALRSDPDRNVRIAAARAIAKVKDPAAIMPLIHAMTDNDRKVRLWVWKGILAMGKPAVRRVIVHLSIDSPVDNNGYINEVGDRVPHQEVARERLATLGKDWIPLLIEHLDHPDIQVKMRTTLVLQEMGKEAKPAIPKFIEIAKGTHAESRRYAVRGLGKLGELTPDVMPALEEAAKVKDKSVAEEAKRAISRIKKEKEEKEKKKKEREEKK